jgi:S-adenosylmethionine synthetase
MSIQTFTAEYVSPKHPDKMCDRISDTILEKFISQDPNSRVAVETLGGHGKVFIVGGLCNIAEPNAFNTS